MKSVASVNDIHFFECRKHAIVLSDGSCRIQMNEDVNVASVNAIQFRRWKTLVLSRKFIFLDVVITLLSFQMKAA